MPERSGWHGYRPARGGFEAGGDYQVGRDGEDFQAEREGTALATDQHGGDWHQVVFTNDRHIFFYAKDETGSMMT
jgi:hypothetical protein